MLHEMEGSCPLHGRTAAAGCDWCVLEDLSNTLELIRAAVHAHVTAAEPRAFLVGVIMLARVGDTLLVAAPVSAPGRSIRPRRFFVRPGAVFPLD